MLNRHSHTFSKSLSDHHTSRSVIPLHFIIIHHIGIHTWLHNKSLSHFNNIFNYILNLTLDDILTRDIPRQVKVRELKWLLELCLLYIRTNQANRIKKLIRAMSLTTYQINNRHRALCDALMNGTFNRSDVRVEINVLPQYEPINRRKLNEMTDVIEDILFTCPLPGQNSGRYSNRMDLPHATPNMSMIHHEIEPQELNMFEPIKEDYVPYVLDNSVTIVSKHKYKRYRSKGSELQLPPPLLASSIDADFKRLGRFLNPVPGDREVIRAVCDSDDDTEPPKVLTVIDKLIVTITMKKREMKRLMKRGTLVKSRPQPHHPPLPKPKLEPTKKPKATHLDIELDSLCKVPHKKDSRLTKGDMSCLFE
jgi:hypothetical protein